MKSTQKPNLEVSEQFFTAFAPLSNKSKDILKKFIEDTCKASKPEDLLLSRHYADYGYNHSQNFYRDIGLIKKAGLIIDLSGSVVLNPEMIIPVGRKYVRLYKELFDKIKI